jgi:polysaccharide export outer membrane protein
MAGYRIRAADHLAVRVYGRSSMSPLFEDAAMPISPSGKIVLPVGEVEVAGLTEEECRERIRTAFGKHVAGPTVHVSVPRRSGAKAHVFGEVRSPGTFQIDGETTTTEAILMAGGFTPEAATDRVVLVRPAQAAPAAGQEAQPARAAELDFAKLLAEADFRADAVLRPGDILYVPPTRMASSARFHQHVQSIMAPYLSVMRLIGDVILINEALKGNGK